jgi:F420-non-reducing hydrogenase large subunit
MSRRITIDPLTRLEGHGKIEIVLDERGEVETAFLQVPELRGFERFCLGRPAEEMPRITAHICGVCPAAHHIASARALDAVWQVEPPPAAHKLRELYYNLFLLEDHALHFYYLGGPDLLVPEASGPMRSILGVVERLGKEVGGRVVAVRKEARAIMAAMAGRTVHPAFALPGGVSRPLARETVERVRRSARDLVDFATFTLQTFEQAVVESAAWRHAIESEAFQLRTHSMGLVDADGSAAFYRGALRVVDPAGAELARFAPSEYLDHLAEHVEPWTYVKFPFLNARGWTGFTEGDRSGLYRVGPLARLNVAESMATPWAEEHRERMFAALGARPAHQTLAFHWARLVEALQAAETVQILARDPEIESDEVRRLPEATPREGVGVVEAPRGTLIHHYRTDEQGLLTAVNLVVASQHNAGPVQLSVRKAAQALIHGGVVDDALLSQLEMAYRAYDPCNACASHALPGEMPLEVTLRARDGAVLQRLARGIEDSVSLAPRSGERAGERG